MPLQFQNLSTRSSTLAVVNLASEVERAKCMLRFHESRSAVTVQRRFLTVSGREPPTEMLICQWYELFDQTGCIYKGKCSRRWPVSETKVAEVLRAFIRSP
jgi:hypothetical protein